MALVLNSPKTLSYELQRLCENKSESELLKNLREIPRRVLEFFSQAVQDYEWSKANASLLQHVFKDLTDLVFKGRLPKEEAFSVLDEVIRFEGERIDELSYHDIAFIDKGRELKMSTLLLSRKARAFRENREAFFNVQKKFPLFDFASLKLYYRTFIQEDFSFLKEESLELKIAFLAQSYCDGYAELLNFLEDHLIELAQDFLAALELYQPAINTQREKLIRTCSNLILNHKGIYKNGSELSLVAYRTVIIDRKKWIIHLLILTCKNRRVLNIHYRDIGKSVKEESPVNEPFDWKAIESVQFSETLLTDNSLKRLTFSIFSLLPNLASISLDNCRFVNLNYLYHLARTLPNIKQISFSNTEVKGNDLKQIPSLFPRISSLRLKGHVIPDGVLEEILELKSIEFLNLEEAINLPRFSTIKKGLFNKIRMLHLRNDRSQLREDLIYFFREATSLSRFMGFNLKRDQFHVKDIPLTTPLEELYISSDVLRDITDFHHLLKRPFLKVLKILRVKGDNPVLKEVASITCHLQIEIGNES